jgi:hypothetical protein
VDQNDCRECGEGELSEEEALDVDRVEVDDCDHLDEAEEHWGESEDGQSSILSGCESHVWL